MKAFASLTVYVCALSMLLACGKGGNGNSTPAPTPGGDVDGISIAPDDVQIQLDGSPADPVQFEVTAHYSNGTDEIVDPADVSWALRRDDDVSPGLISSGGELTPNSAAGGVVTVAARWSGYSAYATVTQTLDVEVGDPGDPADWTGTPTENGVVPVWAYPSDGTVFPVNIYKTTFQWLPDVYTEFRITFSGAYSDVVVYSDGTHPLCTPGSAGCWETNQVTWSYIAASNAGSDVTVVVDALDRSTMPPTVRRSAPLNLSFSKNEVKGAMFYWSTTSKGIRRGTIDSATPEDYITGTPATSYAVEGDVACVACHVVSRDGRYIAAVVDAQAANGLWIMEVTSASPPTPLVTDIANTNGHGFATISPDNSMVMAAWGGVAWVVDRLTGAYVADVDTAGIEVTHPDWSPDNTAVTFATGAGDGPKDASVATISYDAGNQTWGTPEILVQAEPGFTNLFPMYSHDAAWIAYSRGTKGGHGDATAQLYIVPADGGTPIELAQANRIVSNLDTTGEHANTQPTWAPQGDYQWIAFNSTREYGLIQAAGTQQIWVTAVDPAKAQAGVDPSAPAFRIPFQGLGEDNHRAYWTTDINDSPDSPD